MSSSQAELPEWLRRKERGSAATIRFTVWLALAIGRPAIRMVLPAICFYFLLFSSASRRASTIYLGRALARVPTFRDVFRHYHSFASCVLDRVFLLKGCNDLYDLRIHGEDAVDRILAQGGGCVMFGAHMGSFEVLRAAGRRHSGAEVKVVMYEENARKITAALNAINPELAKDVISLGKPDAFLTIQQCLEQGDAVGILADRSLANEKQVVRNFLGAPALFAVAPFRMAAVLRKPVVIMVGLYRGGNRYELHFEPLELFEDGMARSNQEIVDSLMDRYIEKLDHYCRIAPYNWFNFYNIWH